MGVLSGTFLLLFISLKYLSAKYFCTNFPSKPLILYYFMPNICCTVLGGSHKSGALPKRVGNPRGNRPKLGNMSDFS